MRWTSLLCLLFALPANAALIVDQSFTSGNNEANAINECCAFSGQTYTAGLSGTLAGVSVDVFESPLYTFPLDVQIRTVSGGFPTTTILGETTITAFGLGDIITFPQTISQIAGVQYAIAVHFPGAPPQGNGVGGWSGATGNLYPGGMIVDSADGGVTWPIFFPDSDSHFITYVNPVPEPSSGFLLGLGITFIVTTFRLKKGSLR